MKLWLYRNCRGLFLILCISLLTACHNTHKQQRTKHSIQIQPQTLHQQLHFAGIVQPLHAVALTSPNNAIVINMQHAYGQWITKDTTIFTLNSQELQKEFNQAFTEYLKAKDNFTIANAKFHGTQDLWQAGLIAKNNYLSEQSSLATSRLSLLQSTKNLAEILHKTGQETLEDLTNLSFKDFKQVNAILSNQHNNITIKAPYTGVLLYPPTNLEQNIDNISIGTNVKIGQVLGIIGDLSGIHINITVAEVDIAKLYVGMPVLIHSNIFTQQTLKGELVAISSQAQSTSGNDLPTFNATIEVRNLTQQQRNFIKVGMSVTLDCDIVTAKKIVLPLAAILQNANQTIVQVRNADGKIYNRKIVTGAISNNQVVIESGLSAGETVVYASN